MVRIVRERFEKHMRNFQPCAHLATGRKRTAGFRAGAMPSVLASKKKAHCWSHFIRLAKKGEKHVPSSVTTKDILVAAGLGEKKVDISEDAPPKHSTERSLQVSLS